MLNLGSNYSFLFLYRVTVICPVQLTFGRPAQKSSETESASLYQSDPVRPNYWNSR